MNTHRSHHLLTAACLVFVAFCVWQASKFEVQVASLSPVTISGVSDTSSNLLPAELAETVMANQDSKVLVAIATSVANTPTPTPWPTRSPVPTMAMALCNALGVDPGDPCKPYLTPIPTAVKVTPTIPPCAHPLQEAQFVIVKGNPVCLYVAYPTPAFPTGVPE